MDPLNNFNNLNVTNSDKNASASVNPGGILNNLKLNAQLTGYSGETWPTDYSQLTQGSIFFNTTDNKLYIISLNVDSDNTFDSLIKIRQGHFNWVEFLFDEETKESSSGIVVDPKNELTEYPTNVTKDLIDIVTKVYLKFDYTNPVCKQFIKDIKNVKDNCLIGIIENYLSCTIDSKFVESPEIIANLCNALMLIVFNNYTF